MREEQVVKISKALKNTTCQEAQNATGHSVVTFFFFFRFSTVNSQLQTALLNLESFPSFQNTLIIIILLIIILQQQTQGISPSENIGDHVRIPLNSFRGLTLILWNVSTYSPYQH